MTRRRILAFVAIAFGLLTVDVKNDYVQTHVSLHDPTLKTRNAGGLG